MQSLFKGIIAMKSNLPSGLYPLPLKGRLYVTTEQLLQANAESIRLGFNRNLHLPKKAMKKAKLKYPVVAAKRHVGFNGKDYDNENIRLIIMFGMKRDGSDLTPCFLDITPDMFAEIQGNSEIVSPADETPRKNGNEATTKDENDRKSS